MRIKTYLDSKSFTSSATDGRIRFAVRRLLPQRRPVFIKPEAAPRKPATETAVC